MPAATPLPLLALSLGLSAILTLGACSGADQSQSSSAPAASNVNLTPLQAVIASPSRGENAERDVWRNPEQTLEFLGLDENMSVIEIWPGGGWYSDILVPYSIATNGQYIAAMFHNFGGARFDRFNQRFLDGFSDEVAAGHVISTPFGDISEPLAPPNSIDMVFSFRNVHNWMGASFAEKAFDDFYAALKPGGILGVVEHRLPATAEQDPRAPTGYVQEAYVKQLAAEAGFEFVGSTELNANPKDTADHPHGVWTLAPSNRREDPAENDIVITDGSKYEAIGESDRMTLKFRKP